MKPLAFTILLFGLVGFGRPLPLQAQTDTDIEITLKNGTSLEEKGRQQLKRLLSEYDLGPWIFTRKVVIESHVIPHSHPVLTLNTRYVDDDLRQLSAFLHEQAHWFEAEDERKVASRRAIEALRQMYPDPPRHEEIGTRSEHSTYLHLLINWLELDAMGQLVGEQTAREVLSQKGYYKWVYDRVLKDAEAIGSILAEYGLVIRAGEE